MERQNAMYFDERDTLFARTRLMPGSRAYRDYYSRHPERQQADDELRTSGGLMRLATAGRMTGEQISGLMPLEPGRLLQLLMELLPPLRLHFQRLRGEKLSQIPYHLIDDDRLVALIDDSTPTISDLMEADRKKSPVSQRLELTPERASRLVKEVTRFYGAALVGITAMKDYHYYTHRSSGDSVDQRFEYAIVFAVVMDRQMVNRAPHHETLLATCNGYVDAAFVGARLSAYIKSLGYDTSLNTMAKYDAPLVPLAEHAGIGQSGRCNFIVTKDYGNRIRLGAVLTNLPLLVDELVDFGLKEFCGLCGKCAGNCPGDAISHDKPASINERLVWAHDEVKCMQKWLEFGTDCGICIASCPFTQGIDPLRIAEMKGNPDVMRDILREHDERHGSRAFTRDRLPIADPAR
ncbi:MAG: 4Fe-4S dicluster domain-containing protein [Chloroflexota bacterium]